MGAARPPESMLSRRAMEIGPIIVRICVRDGHRFPKESFLAQRQLSPKSFQEGTIFAKTRAPEHAFFRASFRATPCCNNSIVGHGGRPIAARTPTSVQTTLALDFGPLAPPPPRGRPPLEASQNERNAFESFRRPTAVARLHGWRSSRTANVISGTSVVIWVSPARAAPRADDDTRFAVFQACHGCRDLSNLDDRGGGFRMS